MGCGRKDVSKKKKKAGFVEIEEWGKVGVWGCGRSRARRGLGLWLLEGKTDAFGGGEIGVDAGEGGGGFFEREAEGDEGIEGFVGGGGGGLTGGGGMGAVVVGRADLVAEVDNDAFGGLFADAGGLGDISSVGEGDGVADIGRRAEAENGEGGFGADAVDREEEFEEFLGGEAAEAIEIFPVFADGVIGVEFLGGAKLGLFGFGGGYEELVADIVDIDDEVVIEFFGHLTNEMGNHCDCPS